MTAVIYGLHLMVVIALILMVLMQRSEGGALGMGGGGGGGLMTGRGAADALARGTGALGAVFFLTSIALTMMAGGNRAPSSVVDQPASFSLSFEPVQRFFEDVTKGFSSAPAKPSVTPAPETIATPVPADPILPASTAAPVTDDVAPAPTEALARAAPLEPPAASVRPAAPALAATTPARPAVVTSARPPAAVAARSATPAAVSSARAPASVSASGSATAATAPKPAESTLPQVPAERPRGRAGPDE
jgi:preprotein translocase subunit SecG